jgi:hypothetical protein
VEDYTDYRTNMMEDINQKLETLYDLLVDNSGLFKSNLTELIANPEKIANTNKFASLLSELNFSELINPLLKKIGLADKTDLWLTDFMYAASNLLDECGEDQEFDVPKNLVIKLEDWIINYTGELAWYSAALLKFYDSESAAKIQLQKLEQRGGFFLIYVECIIGLLRFNKKKYMILVKEIANDKTRDEKLVEYCQTIT